MLCFTAITPHPPISIPNVGGKNIQKIANTISSLKQLGNLLADSSPDAVIVITPHGTLIDDAFTVNMSEKFYANFKKFGDFITQSKYLSDFVLAQQIKEDSKHKTIYINNELLDHGISVPLHYLTEQINNLPIVPIGHSFKALKDHYDFGANLFDIINKTPKKIAVIASGDLSHRLTPEAPAGFSKQGVIFDEKIIQLIKDRDIDNILNLNDSFIKKTGECGLRSIVMLLGLLSKTNYQPKILSYEGPFGVGYMVANFAFELR